MTFGLFCSRAPAYENGASTAGMRADNILVPDV